MEHKTRFITLDWKRSFLIHWTVVFSKETMSLYIILWLIEWRVSPFYDTSNSVSGLKCDFSDIFPSFPCLFFFIIIFFIAAIFLFVGFFIRVYAIFMNIVSILFQCIFFIILIYMIFLSIINFKWQSGKILFFFVVGWSFHSLFWFFHWDFRNGGEI